MDRISHHLPAQPEENAEIKTDPAEEEPPDPKHSYTKESLRLSDLTSYWDTTPPTPTDLHHADRFFTNNPPTLLFTTDKFRLTPQSDLPEVTFLGRSNSGKSTLLNALFGKEMCFTSSKPGRTATMNGFQLGGGNNAGRGNTEGMPRLVVLDMPGYGHGSRPEWGTEITKYLSGRKQLRRAFVLIDAKVGIKKNDAQLLALLRQSAIPHQVVMSKVDAVLFSNKARAKKGTGLAILQDSIREVRNQIQPQVNEGPPALGEIICCSGEMTGRVPKKLGVDALRHAVLKAVGLDAGRGFKGGSKKAMEKQRRRDDAERGRTENMKGK